MTMSSDNEFLFTSESVTEGHPDKIADQISDGVLDAVMRDDPTGRVACETLVNTGLVVVSGEITTDDLRRHPGDRARDDPRRSATTTPHYGFDYHTCAVINAIDKQSPDIAQGVDQAYESRARPGDDDELDVAGAGDQGMMFGYATQRDRRADADADRARPQAGQAARRRAQGRDRPYLRPGRQDAGHRPLRGRPPGRDREAADLDPAPRGRRVADQRRPLGARGRAGAARGPLRRAQAAARRSWSTRPAGSSSAARWATAG